MSEQKEFQVPDDWKGLYAVKWDKASDGFIIGLAEEIFEGNCANYVLRHIPEQVMPDILQPAGTSVLGVFKNMNAANEFITVLQKARKQQDGKGQ